MKSTDNGDRLAEIPEAEVNVLLDKLSAHAFNRIRSLSWRGIGSTGVLPNGESAETIVQVAVGKLLSGAKWDASKDAETILRGIVDSHISNLVRTWENKNFINPSNKTDEDGAKSGFDAIKSSSLNPIEFLERSEDDEAALEILESFDEGTPEHRIIAAIFNGPIKRAAIMEEANVSEKEYEATKKRLRTFLRKYWQNRDSAQH